MSVKRTPGAALWISLTASALVLGLGAGTGWWFLVGRDLEHAASLSQSADDVVFTGDDLHFFLLGEKSLAEAGLPITLGTVDSVFFADAGMGARFEPEQCGAIYHDVTDAPAGARRIDGSINEDGTDGYSQQVVQFATLDEAIAAYESVTGTLDSCAEFVAQGVGEESQTLALSQLSGSDNGPTVALIGPEGSDATWGWIILRRANVVVVTGYSAMTASVTEEQARALGMAVHERAVYATAKKRSSGE